MYELVTKQITDKINCKTYRDYMGSSLHNKKLLEIKSHEGLPINKFILRYVYQNKTYTKIVTLESVDNSCMVGMRERYRNNNKNILSNYDCGFYDSFTMYPDDNELSNYGCGNTGDIDNMIEILKTISGNI